MHHFVSTAVTFCVFFIEGLLHYNIGLNSKRSFSNLTLGFPGGRDFFSMIAVLSIFSTLNGIIISFVTANEKKLYSLLGITYDEEKEEEKKIH